METILHHVITLIKEAVEHRVVTLGAFQDIRGAFDSTSFDIITKAAKWHVLGDMTCWWIGSVLGGQKITTTFAGETLEGSVARACPQGAFYCLCCGTFLHIISEHLQEALNVVQHWCNRTQLSINPQNMVIVPFTRKRD